MADTVTISALGHGGDGLAEAGGQRVFVPYTLPGETVEIERDGERATLLRVVTPSADRVPPVCINFGKCGICALEHMAPAAYLAWKRDQVVAAFAQRGIAAEIAPTVAIGARSRRRAIFSTVRTPKGVVLGFHARTSKTIVDIDACEVLVPGIVRKLPVLRKIAAVALSRWKPARMTVFLADNGLDVTVADAGKPDQTMLAKLGDIGRDPDIARLTVDGVEVFRNRAPEFAAGAAMLYPTPGGFTQAAKAAEDAISGIVLEDVGNASPVADLFAGIGTFSFRLAAHSPVTAVEGDAALVAAIDAAARRAKGVRKVTAVRRDLFSNPLAPLELNKFGAVVFDPPASGAKAQAEMLAKSKVPIVVAVSCNPATLARDARILIDGGYTLKRVVPVDQFLFSAEIEAVASFTR